MSQVRICSVDPSHVTTEEGATVCAQCQAPLTVREVATRQGQPVEFIFVVDGTGSMGGEIGFVKENLVYFTELLRANQQQPRVGLVVFRDFDYDGDLAMESFPLTDDADAFSDQIQRITATGGGDEPEHALDGLLEAVSLFGGEPAKRCIMLITDAPTKPSRDGKDTRQVAGILRQHRVVLQVLVSDRQEWKDLSDNPRSFFYDLNRVRADRSAMDDALSRIVGTIVAAA